MVFFEIKSISFLLLVFLALPAVKTYGLEVDDTSLEQNSLHQAILRIFKGHLKLLEEDENNDKGYKFMPSDNRRYLQLLAKSSDRDGKKMREETNVTKKRKYDQQKRGGIQSLAKNRDFPRKSEPQPPQKELVITYNYSYREEPRGLRYQNFS